MLTLAVFCAVACVLLRGAEAACANGCSGHGTCGQNNICSCFTGWDGGAADCSFRKCPTGPAWADKAYASDKAHLPATCSNAGHCNYATGECKCFPGFTGAACQRNKCPNDCNGHGQCVSIADISFFYGMDYIQDGSGNRGDGQGVVYTNWDKDSITMCECDAGFFAADCSLQMCAKGDDPLTVNQNYRSISLMLETASAFSGDIGLTFMGVTGFIDMDDPTDSQCKLALESSQHISTVSCTRTVIEATKWKWDIVFHTWPTLSRSNNLYNHNGNPALSEFTCDGSLAGGTPTCHFADVQTLNIKEWSYCSNRGKCDFGSGLCSCDKGYGGIACGNSTFFQGITGSNTLPGMQILVDGSDYTGDALQIRSAKSAAADFYLIEAIANKQRMFYVRGDGTVGFTSLVTPGGATIGSGGLMVSQSGATITSGGLIVSEDGATISSTDSTKPAITVDGKATSYGMYDTVFDIKTDNTNSHYVFSAKDSTDTNVFTVRSTGRVDVIKGGLYVTDGGISINDDGIEVYGGITAKSGGLRVEKMGITVTEGSIVAEDGIHIKNKGLQIDSGPLKLMSAGADIISGGLRVHAGKLEVMAGLKVTGGSTVNSGGLRVNGGATVKSHGFVVDTGGATITAGGLVVGDTGLTITAGGQTITAGGLLVSDTGLTITAGGQTITGGGLLVSDTGLTVTAGGQTITSGGLLVSDTGLTVATGGVKVTQSGLTVTAGGLVVGADGLSVAGGLTISDTGIVFGGQTLTGVDDVANNGAGYILTTSDRRLKDRLTPMKQPLEKIERLRGVYYHWTENQQKLDGFNSKRHFGYMAQDVHNVLPEAVHTQNDGTTLAIDFPTVVPLLSEGINEMHAKVRALETRVQQMEQAEKRRLASVEAEVEMSEAHAAASAKLAKQVELLLARVEALEAEKSVAAAA